MEQAIGLPRDVLELVVDVLISSMKSLSLEALATEDCCVTHVDGYGVERRTLSSMSLVHRTWTDIVRRGLWHRVIFRDSDLKGFNISDNAPNHSLTRELALIGSGSDDEPYWENFTAILRHSRNLRELYIDVDVHDPMEAGFLQLMQQLRLCSHLESLWLVGGMEDCYEEILRTVSCLPCLRTLVLDTVIDENSDSAAPRELELPKNLKSVALVDALVWKYASRLIRPCGDRHILDLSFSLEYPDQLEEEESAEPLHECLQHLRTLHISTCSTDRESERDIHSECLAPLLGKTRELTRFALTASMLRTSSLHLPDTLATLHVHHDAELRQYLSRGPDILKENDRNIAAVISGSRPIITTNQVSSRLRKVILSFTYDGAGITEAIHSRLQNEVFAETQLACSLGGIETVFETYASPYLGILAETYPFAF